jgi:hypothetical protein
LQEDLARADFRFAHLEKGSVVTRYVGREVQGTQATQRCTSRSRMRAADVAQV